MASRIVNQNAVKWIPRKNGKGGFLALKSNPTKPFSGTVVGVKKGTTATSKSGAAKYVGGRNVLKRGAEGAKKSRPISPKSGTVTSAIAKGRGRTATSPAVSAAAAAGKKARTSSTVSSAKAKGMAMGPKSRMSPTVAAAKSRGAAQGPLTTRFRPDLGRPGEYQAGAKTASKGATSATVAAAKARGGRGMTSPTVAGARATGLKPRPSATVAAAKSKGAKRYAGYRQSRWSS